MNEWRTGQDETANWALLSGSATPFPTPVFLPSVMGWRA